MSWVRTGLIGKQRFDITRDSGRDGWDHDKFPCILYPVTFASGICLCMERSIRRIPACLLFPSRPAHPCIVLIVPTASAIIGLNRPFSKAGFIRTRYFGSCVPCSMMQVNCGCVVWWICTKTVRNGTGGDDMREWGGGLFPHWDMIADYMYCVQYVCAGIVCRMSPWSLAMGYEFTLCQGSRMWAAV